MINIRKFRNDIIYIKLLYYIDPLFTYTEIYYLFLIGKRNNNIQHKVIFRAISLLPHVMDFGFRPYSKLTL